jgi:ABC-type multidrug transport system fused ATPase/permease subunit
MIFENAINYMNQDFTIVAKNLHFDYNEKTKVFNDHNINLVVNKSQKNKLYGIIGPSGTGKTTLISILGGQLKPTSGYIEIDKVNIYEVTDSVRRGLITMQMQTSTSLRGKLKYNMVFGLPENTFSPLENNDEVESNDNISQLKYTDDYLIQVLKNVGLWSIFKDKDGLDTLIGEGGLNLSGGQRQRLNFAGLYLRAKHFQPSLILIDEPTSSLDEISEMAITKMILELAQIAVTFVVAHRLKTLEEAVAILDSSLIDSDKDLNFYSRSDLKSKSQYYQDLMAGKAKLDDE